MPLVLDDDGATGDTERDAPETVDAEDATAGANALATGEDVAGMLRPATGKSRDLDACSS